MTGPSLRAFDALATNQRVRRGTPVPQLPLSAIGPLAGQPRQHLDPVALAELAESIKAHGVIQPIIVIARRDATDDDPIRYRIVCGERRFQAAKLAGMDAIAALVRDYDDDEVAVLALLENLQREDLTPLEEAEYLAQLKQRFGFTEEQLGDRLGKSRDYVHMRLRLLNLKPDLVAVWRTATTPEVFERFTPSHAILLNQVTEDGPRAALLDEVTSHGLTVAETRRRLEAMRPPTEAVALVPRAGKPAPRRLAVAPAPAAEAAVGRGPALALDDLALVALLRPLLLGGVTTVALLDLEEALKQDTAWLRQIGRDGLRSG